MPGRCNYDYVWVYNTNVGHTNRRFTTAHRSILHATKSRNNRFYKEQVAQPYQNPTGSATALGNVSGKDTKAGCPIPG